MQGLDPSRVADRAPGVYLADATRPASAPFETGVPVFIGDDGGRLGGGLRPATLDRSGLEAAFPRAARGVGDGPPAPLARALRAFFDNGGRRCWVVPAAQRPAEDGGATLRRGLEKSAVLDGVDLVVTPDVAVAGARPEDVVRRQREVLDHCAHLGNRLALLDATPGAGPEEVVRQGRALASPVPGRNRPSAPGFGALYHPWLRLRDGGTAGPAAFMAGLLARGDREAGHHPGAANVELESVVDVAADLDRDTLARLAEAGVNPLVARPGRGIRAWGERTLSRDAAHRPIAARRTVIALVRWLARHAEGLVFEPDDAFLQARIHRQVGGFLAQLHRRGALAGPPGDAYDVRCRPRAQAGQVVTEIGLRPAGHLERIEVRLVLDDAGFHLGTPA